MQFSRGRTVVWVADMTVFYFIFSAQTVLHWEAVAMIWNGMWAGQFLPHIFCKLDEHKQAAHCSKKVVMSMKQLPCFMHTVWFVLLWIFQIFWKICFKSLRAKIQFKCKRKKRGHAVLEHLVFAMYWQVVAAAFPLGWVWVWKKVKGVREVLFLNENSFFEYSDINTNQRVW